MLGTLLMLGTGGSASGSDRAPRLTLGIAGHAAPLLPVYLAMTQAYADEGIQVELVSLAGEAALA